MSLQKNTDSLQIQYLGHRVVFLSVPLDLQGDGTLQWSHLLVLDWIYAYSSVKPYTYTQILLRRFINTPFNYSTYLSTFYYRNTYQSIFSILWFFLGKPHHEIQQGHVQSPSPVLGQSPEQTQAGRIESSPVEKDPGVLMDKNMS